MDTSIVEKISPDYWLNSQLSIARHYGSIKINSVLYHVDPKDNFLVRDDIWIRELRERAGEIKAEALAEKQRRKIEEKKQGNLF